MLTENDNLKPYRGILRNNNKRQQFQAETKEPEPHKKTFWVEFYMEILRKILPLNG